MKNKIVKILAVVFLLLVLGGAFFLKFSSDKKEQSTTSATGNESVTASGFDKEESEKIQRAQVLAEKIKNTLPSEIFGGLYFDDDQNLVANVTDLNDDSVLKLKNDSDSQDVTFRQVKYSLAFLESVRSELIPFMAEYNIATIDANEVTNKIDIELYQENKEIENLVSEYIDFEDVTVTVLPEDVEIRFSSEK